MKEARRRGLISWMTRQDGVGPTELWWRGQPCTGERGDLVLQRVEMSRRRGGEFLSVKQERQMGLAN